MPERETVGENADDEKEQARFNTNDHFYGSRGLNSNGHAGNSHLRLRAMQRRGTLYLPFRDECADHHHFAVVIVP